MYTTDTTKTFTIRSVYYRSARQSEDPTNRRNEIGVKQEGNQKQKQQNKNMFITFS